MPDTGSVLYRVRGFVSGVNWRPTRFAEDVSYYHRCRLCLVLPRSTVLLPCMHTLCESCHDRVKNAGSVCPLDGEVFEADDCQSIRMPARKAENLKAHCWNEAHGCDFVGTLQSMLQHYEEECSFHDVSCPRCGESVLDAELPSHCAAGCGNAEATAGTEPQQLHEVTRGDVATALLTSGIKASVRDSFAEQLPVLETRMNELTEQTRLHEGRLQEITAGFANTLETLNTELTQAVGKFSATFAEALRAQQSSLYSSVQTNTMVGASCSSAKALAKEYTLSLLQENTLSLHNLERMVGGLLRCLEEVRLYAALRFEDPKCRKTVASLSVDQFGGVGSPREINRAFYRLTVRNTHVACRSDLGTEIVSTVVTTCHSHHTSLTVSIRTSGYGYSLEVAFFSNSQESHCPAAKVLQVSIGVHQQLFNPCELKEDDALVSHSSRRCQLFYLERRHRPLPNFIYQDTLTLMVHVQKGEC